MSVVYIISDHGNLGRSGETLEFKYRDGTIRKIFPYKTDILVITANVNISGRAIRLLTKYSINTIFLAKNGKYNGKLQFAPNKNVFLRKKQYSLLDDEKSVLNIAKSIVVGKIRNQITATQRIKRKESLDDLLAENINSLKGFQEKAEKAIEIGQLRGIEGAAARAYFSVFKYNIKPDWAKFPKRSKNPPQTNVNAVLSFLYTLLLYRVESAIETVGLDPMVGFLHALDYGKNTLVFDMMEEFRAPIADSLCASLFNLDILKPNDFVRKNLLNENYDLPLEDETEEINNEAKFAILLNGDGLKKVISAFEKKINTEIMYYPLKKKMSLNRIIIEQIKLMKRVINDEEAVYKGFVSK